jgi:O-antigen ligase
VVAALPWLLPTHTEPWPTFYSEALMAIVLLPIAAWALWKARGGWRIDAVVAGFGLVACVPLVQAAAGQFAFPGEAWLIAVYLTGMALAIAVAQRAQEVAPLRLADALFASLTMAALVSTGLALYQWFGLDFLGLAVAPPSAGGRPAANLGQSNNLYTLLVWGLLSLWWAHKRGHLGGWVAGLAAAFVLTGVALTQSRTGWLEVGLLAAAAVLGSRALGTRRQAPAFLALALWFVVLVAALESLGHLVLQAAPLTLAQQVNVGKRPLIWQMALQAIGQHPWAGYGWNQSVQASVDLAPDYPQLHYAVAHAHDLILDLALWNGVPLAGLLVGGLGLLIWHHVRGPLTATQWLLGLAVGVFLLHAMLELPHVYAFFLLPVALLVGTLGALRPPPAVARLPRPLVGLVVLLHAAVLLVMFQDYGRIEADAMAYRFRTAHIGVKPQAPRPQVWFLGSLQSALETFRAEPTPDMSSVQLDAWKRTVRRYPSPFALFRYAQASALNGRPADARWALGLLCALQTEDMCQRTTDDWKAIALQEGYPDLQPLPLPQTTKAE